MGSIFCLQKIESVTVQIQTVPELGLSKLGGEFCRLGQGGRVFSSSPASVIFQLPLGEE